MASSSNPSPPPLAGPPPPSPPHSSSSSWLSPFPSPLIPPPPPLPCANEEHKAGVPYELTSFRAREGKQARENKLRELWSSLPAKEPTSPPSTSSTTSSSTSTSLSQPSSSSSTPPTPPTLSIPSSSSPSPPSAAASSSSPPPSPGLSSTLSPERAEALLSLYQQELVRRCTSTPSNPHAREFAGEGLGPWDREQGEPKKEKVVDWKQFRTYLWEKEAGESRRSRLKLSGCSEAGTLEERDELFPRGEGTEGRRGSNTSPSSPFLPVSRSFFPLRTVARLPRNRSES